MDRFDRLAPRDIAITLRSLRRRFGPVQQAAASQELAPVLDAPGPGGCSLTQILTRAGQAAALVTNELVRSLEHDEPVIPAAALDADDRSFTDDRSWSPAQSIGLVSDEAERAADRVERATADEIARPVKIAGGGTTTPLALARALCRETIKALEDANDQIEWLRAQV